MILVNTDKISIAMLLALLTDPRTAKEDICVMVRNKKIFKLTATEFTNKPKPLVPAENPGQTNE